MSVLRNLAAHGRAGEVTVERAADYLALADALLYAIRNKPRSTLWPPANRDSGSRYRAAMSNYP